ncbi:uncharacterized protein LOC113461173 [Phoenix dactylifera]|uniref:Uncharacterized protein LOC113461173 n=1 Tax=Phoenix dactylifera TaxID=42345 RepID=A0A8B8IZI4_PHODC|nr:uncharacterized protein LOC113461173 [Phoenix dactylifera]
MAFNQTSQRAEKNPEKLQLPAVVEGCHTAERLPMSDKKHIPPVVAPIGCSKIKSFLSLCRSLSHPQPCPQPKPSLQVISQKETTSNSISAPLITNFSGDREAAVLAYWRRARELEQELRRIDKWLDMEKRQREHLHSMTGKAQEYLGTELMKLSDGSYLHEIKRLGRPWGRLVMQFSVPAIAENATTATEVLCRMASMKVEDLLNSLFESMPMANITGCRTGERKGKPVLVGPENGFLEAILLDAMEKMEGLVLEGLRIQMGPSIKANVKGSKGKEISRQCLILLMLIQVRDPKEDNGAVGEFMIGLIEASAAEVSGRRFHIHGVHIAGMKYMKRTSGKDFIWSVSAERCKGNCNSCCWHVRNPDIVFAQER